MWAQKLSGLFVFETNISLFLGRSAVRLAFLSILIQFLSRKFAMKANKTVVNVVARRCCHELFMKMFVQKSMTKLMSLLKHELPYIFGLLFPLICLVQSFAFGED